MSAEQQKYKRKQIVIDKKFQGKLVIRALIPLVILVILTAILSIVVLGRLESGFHFESTNELIAMLSQRLGNLFQSSAELFSSLRTYTLLLLGLFLLIAGGYVVYIFLYISHRIAGPILRFKRTLGDILNGQLTTRIHLREKDEFKETADSFNEMIEALALRIKRIDQLNNFSQETIVAMKEKASDENKAHFEKLEEISKGISESIHEFHFE